jgi:hypothetical protein
MVVLEIEMRCQVQPNNAVAGVGAWDTGTGTPGVGFGQALVDDATAHPQPPRNEGLPPYRQPLFPGTFDVHPD